MLRSRFFRIVLAALVGLAAPYAELAVYCRAPVSEACVWGRAYLPLTRPVYFVLFGLLAYAVLSLLARRPWRRPGPGDDA